MQPAFEDYSVPTTHKTSQPKSRSSKPDPMVVMTTRVPAQLRRRLWVHFRDDVQNMQFRSMSHIVQVALEEYLDRNASK